jgi:hypothetical protein
MLAARLWFARIAMVYAALIFSFLAYLYMVEPLEHIAGFGVNASGTPEAINFMRAGPGALFTGMALTAFLALARPACMKTCLWVIVLFNGCIVAGRLLGIAVDGVTPMQLTELRDEGLSWLFFLAALFAYPDENASAATGA